MFRYTSIVILLLILIATPTANAQDQAEMGRLVGVGQQLEKEGRLPEAIDAYDRAGAIALQLFGPTHKFTATLNAMAGACYRKLGKYTEAEQRLERALTAYEAGTDPNLTAEGINNLAAVKFELGKINESLALHQRSVKLMETNLGVNSVSAAIARSNLAGAYVSLGQLAAAEPLYLQSIRVLEANKDAKMGSLADTLANLANLYLAQGEMSRAVPLVQRAVLLKEQAYGPRHVEVARTLNNLGAFYSKMGQFDKAAETLQRTLEILEATLGSEHADLARALTNLAEVEKKLKQPGKAESHYLRALKIREAALGPNHPDTATTREHLGSFYLSEKRYAEATNAAERSLKIRQQAGLENQIPVAFSLSVLATIDLCQHKNAEAEDLLKQTLQIRQQALSPNHPETAETQAQLGWLYGATGRMDLAVESFDRSRRGDRKYVEQVLSVLSEPEQTSFLNNIDRRRYFLALSSAYRLKNQTAADFSAGWVLNSKGVAQEVLAQRALVTRDSTNPTIAAISQTLVAIRKQLAFLSFGSSTASEGSRRKKVEDLAKREAVIAKEMSMMGGRVILRGEFVELNTVRKNIPDDAKLVEISKFGLRDFQDPTQEEGPERYAAWVIPPLGAGVVKYIDLGPAEPIDAAVTAVRKKLTGSLQEINESGEPEAEQELLKTMQPLARLILHPLLPLLGDTQNIYLSPDSGLWVVPWNALPLADGKYAVEQFDIRYVISGRDLIPPEKQVQTSTRPILIADPNYDLTPDEVQTATQELFRKTVAAGPVHATVAGQNRLGQVGRLPGTNAEAQAIQPKIEALAKTEAYLYSDKWALEAVFKSLSQPQILVLSTHGFFLEQPKDSTQAAESPNPLLRCGLLLAGCNKPAAIASENTEDGILTGLEIVGTDLRGTDLVVLSACETGLGEVQNGEGVSGLRQAFQLAGARSVVSTLWQIPDLETAQLMTDFFSGLANGAERSEALREAQLKMIKARRTRDEAAHPHFWAAFTITGR